MNISAFNILLVSLGIVLIVFRRPYMRKSIEVQNNMFGTKLGAPEIENGIKFSIIFGIGLVAIGCLNLLGITNIKF